MSSYPLNVPQVTVLLTLQKVFDMTRHVAQLVILSILLLIQSNQTSLQAYRPWRQQLSIALLGLTVIVNYSVPVP